VCHLYGTPKQPTINHARLQLFGKAKKGVEMLAPTRDALDLYAICAIYQAKILLQANKEHIHVPRLIATTESLTTVWTRLPYLRCLRETGDMQLQAKVQDCPMFLLQK